MPEPTKYYLKLNDVSAYKKAYHLSNFVWDIVLQWDYFAKDTVGKQIVRSVDSVSANIAEGFGRHFKKDKIKFYRYAFGSLTETKDWTQKAHDRKLIDTTAYQKIFNELDQLPREINHLIQFTNQKLKE